MTQLEDCFGRIVRLTDERMEHILEHPEMLGLSLSIAAALSDPALVRRSCSDNALSLFYRFLEETAVGGKFLCVVVKYTEGDAFVVTAYLTNKPKAGEHQWPTK